MDNGSHNVSRWMTWLPISLKNAVKCDKWYQLQNHSITESLNANGAWEKLYCVIPVHAIFSVSNKKQHAASSLLHICIYTLYIICVEAKRRRVFVLCAYIYICVCTRRQVRVGQIHACTLFCVGASVETPLWCLRKAVFLSFSFSFSLHFLSSFFIKKGGEKKEGEKKGVEGEAVTRIIKQKTKTRIQLRVGHFLLNGGWVVCVALSLCMCVVYIYICILEVGVCVCVFYTYISAPLPLSYTIYIYIILHAQRIKRGVLPPTLPPDNLCLQT